MCKHGHRTCAKIVADTQGRATGVAAALCLYYREAATGKRYWVMAVGRETSGNYAGQYNLCAGGLNHEDGGCFLETLARELREEFKMDAGVTTGGLDALFRDQSGPKQLRWFFHRDTPVFVGVLPAGSSRASVKAIMTAHMADPRVDHAYKEMDDYEYIRLADGTRAGDSVALPVTAFALAVLRKVRATYFPTD